jgi:cell division protein FtsQ
MFKKFLHIILWGAAIVLIVFSLGFSARKYRQTRCVGLVVDVSDSAQYRFIDNEDVEKWIEKKYNGVFGKRLDSINTRTIEEGLEKLQAIGRAQVYTTLASSTGDKGGSLVVRIEQRRPIFRVFTSGLDYYMDNEGNVMNWTPKYTARVILVGGSVTRKFARETLVPLVSYIDSDDFLKAQIDQIYVDDDSDLTMIPRIGDQRIEFGKADDYRIKFRNLKALYTEGFRHGGWSKYKSINLKYRNQIVCTKK